MKLGALLTAADIRVLLSPEQAKLEVRDLAYDSRKVKPGALFIAMRGSRVDGHEFIQQAIQQGAVAIIAEKSWAGESTDQVPVLRVADTRAALARMASEFFGRPSEKLKLIGITGTKGKTTTSYLVRSIIEAAGHATGLIGTIDYRVGRIVYAAPNTTPESLDIQRLLREMVDSGCRYCVMEVSSHALALGRTDHCVFEAALFTNLKQDHLDFHQDMESYFQAKLLLFTGLEAHRTVVVNNDEPLSQEIIQKTESRAYTFGMSKAADIHPQGAIAQDLTGLSFVAETPYGPVAVQSALVGKYNVYNILAAIGGGIALGFSPDNIRRGIENMKAVPGRLEKVDEGQPFGVIVDYAHTEDSLFQLLEAVREMTQGRIITLFGCGGNRDRTKRPKMGAAALQGSDWTIITSDNPRTEDPLGIICEIEAGLAERGAKTPPTDAAPAGKKPYSVFPDRREAIAAALHLAQPGDVVVLAGKGHEGYQLIGDQKVCFDDREVAREELRKYNAECGLRNAE